MSGFYFTGAQLRHNDIWIFADRSSRNNSENGEMLVIYLTVLSFIKVKHVLLLFENCQMYLPLRVSRLFIVSNWK